MVLQKYGNLTDMQFSTVAILDEAGRLLERTRYQTYGQGLHEWPGDFNGDGFVDDTDNAALSTVAANAPVIGDPTYDPDMDLNRNGEVNDKDLDMWNMWSGRGPLAAGQISDPDGPANTIGYSGYVFNPEAMIYTVRHRHYEPMLGRFMEADPRGYVDGMNLYQYAKGRPLCYTDPSGLQAWGTRQDWQTAGGFFSALWSVMDLTGDIGLLVVEKKFPAWAASAAKLTQSGGALFPQVMRINENILAVMKVGSTFLSGVAGVAGVAINGADTIVNIMEGEYYQAGGDGAEVVLAVGGLVALATSHPGVGILYASFSIGVFIGQEVTNHYYSEEAQQAKTKTRNKAGTCAVLKSEHTRLTAKGTSPCESRMQNIKSSWKAQACSGQLE